LCIGVWHIRFISSRVTEMVAFTLVTLPVWVRDFVAITKGEARTPKLRFHGG